MNSDSTRLDIVNYVLASLSMTQVNSSSDTTHSRLVLDELKLATRSVCHESDWQDTTKDVLLSTLTRSVQLQTCGGAVAHHFTGDVVRVESVWDTSRQLKLSYMDYTTLQRQHDVLWYYVTTDNDFITTDNTFTLLSEYDQQPHYFSFYDNSIFLVPNVYDISAVKVSYVVGSQVPSDDYTPFSLTEELVSLIKLKTLASTAALLRPELVQILELKYQEAMRSTRSRVNYHPTRARRSVL